MTYSLNLISRFATTAVMAVSIIGGTIPEAKAGGSNYQDHITLGNTIRSTGINFKINPARCWDKNSFGWYWAAQNEMVICQENKRSVGVEAQWTEEDLDTLRHEAQHLIQDCMDGTRQGALDSVYKNPIKLAKDVLGDAGIRSVINAYSEVSDHIKVMELEAFSVARMNKPLAQSGDIKHYCF